MVVFFLALLFISAIALSVVAAFALPHLRAGSPVLTDRGERVAERWLHRLGPVTRAVRPAVRPIARWAWARAKPLLGALRPKVAPLTQAISRAVEEGTAPSTMARRPAAGRAGNADGEPSGSDLFGAQRPAARVRAPAVAAPLARN